MKIYLAARYSRHPEMAALAKIIETAGHSVTSRWIRGDHDLSGLEIPEVAERKRCQWAQEDLEDLIAAECCVSFTEPPGPVVGRGRGGRHVEFGIAFATGKHVVVVGFRENVFHYLPGILYFNGVGPFLSSLTEDWLEKRLLEIQR